MTSDHVPVMERYLSSLSSIRNLVGADYVSDTAKILCIHIHIVSWNVKVL